MEEYNKFSREWANSREEENKELQKNYLEQFQKNQDTMFQEPVKEIVKEPAKESIKGSTHRTENEIHMVESDKNNDQAKSEHSSKEHKKKKSPAKVCGVVVGLLLIVCVMVMSGYKATKGQKAKDAEELEAVKAVVEQCEMGIKNKSSSAVMNTFSAERRMDMYEITDAYNDSIDDYLFPYVESFSYEITSIEKVKDDDQEDSAAGDYLAKCEEKYDENFKTVEYRLRKDSANGWEIISSNIL